MAADVFPYVSNLHLNLPRNRVEFIRNNRGINDNKDLPQEYLERLYDEIKNRQIQVWQHCRWLA